MRRQRDCLTEARLTSETSPLVSSPAAAGELLLVEPESGIRAAPPDLVVTR